MTYGLALELAPHNIRVNAIAPGAVAGDRIDRVIAGQAQVKGVPVEEEQHGSSSGPAQAHVDRRGHRVAGHLSLQRRREESLRPVHRGDGRRARGLSAALAHAFMCGTCT